ncbi:MAG: guanylate kinase [Rikenellaceae bacterium]
MEGKLIIFSAPSGAGKTTVVKELLKIFSNFEFSVSATSRAPRGVEQNGVDYHFLTNEEFAQRVKQDEFVEWEEVYAGTCYGTLRSEMQRIWAKGNVILFDVDVMGGIRLKEIFGDAACSIFVMPPSIETLRKRLIGRATDVAEVIEKRVNKAEFEISKSPNFDHTIVNDDLSVAVAQTEEVIRKFLEA